ncbi:MAG: AsmA family protein [Candidatus Omnitrophica bacterium]|nr:AsmA family protein [Candidatus Omnitrophota bacterium]
MKKLLVILIIILVAFFAIGFFKDAIIKSFVTASLEKTLGAPVKIEGFSLGIVSQSVRISGFKIYNPENFEKGVLADLPVINAQCNISELLNKKIHLINLEIELKELLIEKNKEGKLNVDSLKVAQKEAKESKESKASAEMALRIDTLKLGIGKIIYKDFKASGTPSIRVHDINLHKSYKDITSIHQLAMLIITEPMKAAGIQGAKIYGAAMLTGVGFLPAAAAITFTRKDSAAQTFNVPFEKAYAASLAALKTMGIIKKQNKAKGIIHAEVQSARVALKVDKLEADRSKVTVSARKSLFPKPQIAGGVLYEIERRVQ